MKLIIDIDEDYVKIINKNGASNYPEEIILNGIPLPKGMTKEELQALKAIEKIKQIINISNSVIQEDVLKYKMICEVINNEMS